MESENWFFELWEAAMQRRPTEQERKEIGESLLKGRVFYESGLWKELTDTYGHANERDVWELLVAVFDNDQHKAEGIFEKLEASRAK